MKKKILKDLIIIFEKKSLKDSDETAKLKQFDSLVILQIMNLAKTKYKKQIDGRKVASCEKVADIINLLT